MSRVRRPSWLREKACAVTLGAMVAASTACTWGVGVAASPGPYYDDYPPDAYIATTEPVYFEGHAAYWYGNRWYYRDGGHWGHYDREPPVLYQRRMQAPPVRRTYEQPWRGGPPGRSNEHPAGRSGGHR